VRSLAQPPPLDPNWFYSTMAQSTAALLGLLGGLLVSRLMDYKNSDRLTSSQRHVSDAVGMWRSNGFAHTHNWQICRGDEGAGKSIAEQLFDLLEDDSKFRSPRGLRSLLRSANETLRAAGDPKDWPPQAQVAFRQFAEGAAVAERWRSHDRMRFPPSFYLLFVALLGLGGTGLIWPMYYLTGFDSRLFVAFVVGFAVLAFAVGLLLVDLAVSSRVEPGAGDPNYRTRRY